MTPSKALYVYEPPRLEDLVIADIKVPLMKNHLEENQKITQILKENLINAQNQIKQQAGQHGSQKEFKEDDWVFVRHTNNYP
jgi:hypothetical protein